MLNQCHILSVYSQSDLILHLMMLHYNPGAFYTRFAWIQMVHMYLSALSNIHFDDYSTDVMDKSFNGPAAPTK